MIQSGTKVHEWTWWYRHHDFALQSICGRPQSRCDRSTFLARPNQHRLPHEVLPYLERPQPFETAVVSNMKQSCALGGAGVWFIRSVSPARLPNRCVLWAVEKGSGSEVWHPHVTGTVCPTQLQKPSLFYKTPRYKFMYHKTAVAHPTHAKSGSQRSFLTSVGTYGICLCSFLHSR